MDKLRIPSLKMPKAVMSSAALALALALALVASGCGPGFFEPEPTLDNCAAPEGTVDGMPLIVKTTKPFAPRALTRDVSKPWSSGHGMALSGDQLFVADQDNGTLVVVDRNTLAVVRTVAVGARPEQVVVGPSGAVYVSVRHAGTVAFLTPGAVEVTAQLAVGVEPTGLALSPDGSHLFVALAGADRVAVVRVADKKVLASIEAGNHPRALTVIDADAIGGKSGDWLIAIANQYGPAKTVRYSPGQSTWKSNDVALRGNNPGQSTDTGQKLASWRAISATVSPETGETLFAHVLVSPGNESTLLDSVLHDGPTDSNGNTKSSGQSSSGGYGASGPSCSDGTPIRPIEIAVTAATTNASPTMREFAIKDVETQRNFVSRFDQPHDIVHHPKVSLAFVAAYGTDNVLVLSTAGGDPMRFPFAEIQVGMAPRAMAIAPDGKTLYVLNAQGFSISEVSLAPLLATAVDAYPADKSVMPPQVLAAPFYLTAQRSVAFADDPMSAELRVGRRLFTFSDNAKISAGGRFACASCHLEGDEDKQTWFVAQGPRQTPALAGRLQGTGPFNWGGTEDGLQTNMDRTIERMGGDGLSKGELASLEQFMIHGLVPPPNPNLAASGLTEPQLRGQTLFYDAEVGCSTCHSGADTTDGKIWDVGTGSKAEFNAAQLEAQFKGGKVRKVAFNTPSLRGLHHTAPYLHDGSAASLADVLANKQMGKTSHLSNSQRGDLLAFLKTL